MIKTIIVDDEKNARVTLRSLLATFGKKIEIIGEASDLASGVKLIRNSNPDLIFLDIKLKKATGFDLLQQLPGLKAEVIFITAYDQYAIKAFQLAAFGYLLKPVQLSELTQVIERFEARQKQNMVSNHTQVLIENFDNSRIKKLVVQNVNGFKVIPLENIIYLQGEINYTRIFLHNGEKILITKTLKEYDTLLSDFGFFRIHQSHLINLSFVTEYIKGDGGIIIMENGEQLTLSRRRKQKFLTRFLGGKKA
ncbi:MAG: LytR/AlgR family response regulator transcription factor [Saprospiraceae bacterium]